MGFSCLVSEYGEDRDRFFSWRQVVTQKTRRVMGKRFFTVRKVTGTSCSERLQSLHCWRCAIVTCIQQPDLTLEMAPF